jgi:Ca-activated chloride channel family protein
MGVLAPLGLGLLALAIPIVALYMLRMRRRPQAVSSTLLWEQAVRDVRANTPWQQLRANLLLLLQLLALLALVVALIRPFWLGATPLGANIVAIVDVSGSMNATDVTPSRLDRARDEVRRLIDDLPSNGQMTIIAAGTGAEVLQTATADRGALREATGRLHARAGTTDLTEALALAAPVAARLPDTTVAVISDGAFTVPDTSDFHAPIRFIRVGERGDNLGITAAATRRTASGSELFIRTQNFAPVERKALLSIFDGDTLLEARALTIAAGGEAGTTIALPNAVGLLRAQIDSQDDLALDNTAWVRPGGEQGRILLTVAAPNTFLARGLALQPNLTVEQAQGNGTAPTSGGDYDLYVFDGVAPPAGLRGPILLINPPPDNGIVPVTGTLDRPALTGQQRDDPILRGVDVSRVQIAEARAVTRPEWARGLVESNGQPLLLAGETNGQRIAILTFALGRSDLPLTLAYPVLLANLVAWLAPSAGSGLPPSVRPGEVVSFTPRAGVDSVAITDPSGRERRLVPSRGVVLFGNTDMPGPYTVREFAGDREIRRGVLTVNLLSSEESALAPQTPQFSGTAANAGATADARSPREFWRPALITALVILAVEWWIYYRGGHSLGSIIRAAWRDRPHRLRLRKGAA